MHSSRYIRLFRYLLRRHILLQFALLLLIWWVGDFLTRLVHIPIPGPVTGVVVLLGLLSSGILPVICLRRGVNLLLAHLMLLYVPPMLGLRDHPELLSGLGLELIGVVLIGTLVVMSGTALIVEHIVRRGEARAA